MNKPDNIIITAIEKIVNMLDSDGFASFIVILAVLGVGIQIIRALI